MTMARQFIPVIASALFFPLGYLLCAKIKWMNIWLSACISLNLLLIGLYAMSHGMDYYDAIVSINATSALYLFGYIAPVHNAKHPLRKRIGVILMRILIMLTLLIPASVIPVKLLTTRVEDSIRIYVNESTTLILTSSESLFFTISFVICFIFFFFFYLKSPVFLASNHPGKL